MPIVKAMETRSQLRGGDVEALAGKFPQPLPVDLRANYAPAELREGLRQRFGKIKALEIDYIFHTQCFEGEDDIVPWGHHHFAFSAEKRFKAQSGPCCDGEYLYPHYVWAWDGKLQQTFHPDCENAYLEAEQDTWTNCDLYLSNAGILADSLEVERANSKSCSMPWIRRILNSTDRWQVQNGLESVDGAPCHVVQIGNRHKIWLDHAVDFAVRFRESYRRRHPFSQWQLIGRSAYRDYRCLAENLWLPWRLESIAFESNPASIDRSEQRARYSIHEAQKLAANADVPESLFTLQFPVGTVVRDKAHRRFYRLGENGEETKLGEWE